MNISLIIIAVILFIVVYFSKRRYGLLSLALIAGSIISASWTTYLTAMLQIQGLQLISPPLGVVVSLALIVFPVIFLLFVGPKYRKKWQRVVGSLLFAALGALLAAVAIAREAPQLMTGSEIGTIATQTYPLIIVVGVGLAIGDTVMAHLPKKGRKSTD